MLVLAILFDALLYDWSSKLKWSFTKKTMGAQPGLSDEERTGPAISLGSLYRALQERSNNS